MSINDSLYNYKNDIRDKIAGAAGKTLADNFKRVNKALGDKVRTNYILRIPGTRLGIGPRWPSKWASNPVDRYGHHIADALDNFTKIALTKENLDANLKDVLTPKVRTRPAQRGAHDLDDEPPVAKRHKDLIYNYDLY